MAEKRVALLKRANKLFRQGKADAAVKEYKKILEIKPDDLDVRRNVGDLELRQQNIKEAVEQFEWIADYYLNEGFFAKAIAMYKRITRIDPNYETAFYKLAELYTKQGLIMEAKQIYLDIAEECKRKNNQKKALDMYKKILEFDRSNIKMRLLLADNYLKEGLESEAINEYLIATDIITNKKDFRRAEDLLVNILQKVKDIRFIERLVHLYIKDGEDEKATNLISKHGLDSFKDIDMLKVIGELYLKKNKMTEAEKIYLKIAEMNPEETEIIMRLGTVYLQREEYDKSFQLLEPIINRNIENNKPEEAANLLRFIIASNNSYLPALTKLCEVFKITGKTNNLIALYESMIPIYEENNMVEELKGILQELIKLSDTPFTYEEKLAKISGQAMLEEESIEEDEDEREEEFINYNLRVVEDALKVSDFSKAIEILKKIKITFPKNIEIREKLFSIYLEGEQTNYAVEEGKGLLELYKLFDRDHEYTDLLEKLSTLKPEDEKLVALSGDEKTSIEIDFDQTELDEQMQEIGGSDISEEDIIEGGMGDDVLLLSEEENLDEAPLIESEDATKSLSSVLSEVDFYVNDGYFGDAEKLIEQLKQKYPGNKQLLTKIEKLEKAKKEKEQKEDSTSSGSGLDFEIEQEKTDAMEIEVEAMSDQNSAEREHTERIGIEDLSQEDSEMIYQSADSNIEINLNVEDEFKAPSSSGINFSAEDFDDSGIPDHISLDVDSEQEENPPLSSEIDELNEISENGFELGSEMEIESDLGDGLRLDSKPELDLESEIEQDLKMDSAPELELESKLEEELPKEIESEPNEASGDVFELDPSMSAEGIKPPVISKKEPLSPENSEELPELEIEKFENEPIIDTYSEDIFEIESSISEESAIVQEEENSKLEYKIDSQELQKPFDMKTENEISASEDVELEIEMEEPIEVEEEPAMEIDKELLIQAPSGSADGQSKTFEELSSSAIEELDLDSIMIPGEEPDSDLDAPFKEITGQDLAFESEEDLFKDEMPFLNEAYLEIEKNVGEELEAIVNWLKELEKQRTSTIEKNMMEIFEEFKKGVDEKIGQEDFDTRYNLGIAYKEMGLLEEAIHEFLISAKHPLKFFDSAGLLGMSFREKGMFGEAITWFEKALEIPDRRKEEYLAIKYELVLTLKLKEDYKRALELTADILNENQNYRDAKLLFQELENLIK